MAAPGDVRSSLVTEESTSQWEHSPRLRQIKMKIHKFREYVRIYLLSNVEVTRDNSVYVSVTKNNTPERPYMMHKVCKQATNLQIYDYFLKEPRPIPEMDDNNNIRDQHNQDNFHIDNYHAYFDSDSESSKSDSESGIFGVYTDNMMLPLNKKRTLDRVRSLNNNNVYFRFRFKCLHRKQKGYSSEMTEFGENQYQFPLKYHSIFVIANITDEQASTLDVDAGRPGYIPVVHLFNHWLNDLQILPFNHVITFVNDIITTSADIDELILDSASIHMIVTKTLASIKRQWDKYPDDENIQSTNKHYGHNASYQSNLSEDPYELRARNNKKNDISLLNMFDKKKKAVRKDKIREKHNADKHQQINELKKILFRKFLFLFIIASKIDYHHIRQNKKENKNKGKKNANHAAEDPYKRIFDCSLLYWFVRSIYFYQRASIPYILALFRDECDIMGLNILWEAIQINVKCCSDFETFLYLAPFINFFDAIDCFLRSSDQKRSIQSPEILKSNQRTQRTARLVLKMIEIDLSLPVPSNRRFPVEGILLAKMSKRSQHQTEFINLLKTIQKTISYWDDKEKVQYLTSMFQRHHSTISRILDWNWMIHDHYYSFCQTNEVLQIGIATQENNLVTKMRTITRQQFNDRIFRDFVEKWYESIFNQQVTDALMENDQIDAKTIRKFIHYKVRKSISTLGIQSPSPQMSVAKTGSMMATFGVSQTRLFNLDSPQLGARLHSCSINSNNTHTVDWYVNIMLNETSDAIILMIENFVKQRKDALALSLLRYVLASDKHNSDIFDQLSILIANQHYYRLPTRFQQLLGKILSYIHWFPPKELHEIPPTMARNDNIMCPGSPMNGDWGNIADLPHSNKPTPLSLGTLLANLSNHNSNNESGSPNIAQSRTSITMEEITMMEGGPLPSSLSPTNPPLTALNMMNYNGPQSVRSSTNINTPINRSRMIRPGSVLDNKQQRRNRDREKQRSKLIEVFGSDNVPNSASLDHLKLMDEEQHDAEEKSVSPAALSRLNTMNSNVAVKALSPNAVEEEEDDDVVLYFTTHVLTFEEKKEMMLWLNEYVIMSQDVDMYAFWDFIFLNIIKLPNVMNISDYDSSLFSDASQILSPKIHETIKGHLDEPGVEKKKEQTLFHEMKQDPDESRIDLFLAYIMNEYEKINDKGTNIYKLNVLHNQITLIFEDLDGIIWFGLRAIEMVCLYQKAQTKQITDAAAHQSSSSPPPPTISTQQLLQQKLLFSTEIFKPWIASVMQLLQKQLKSGHLLVKTLEYLANTDIIDKKLKNVLRFADIEFNDMDIMERLNVLKNLQNNIRSTEYTDDLKQRIKQNIVQWDYLTLLQVDQLITTLLNDDTKAPTNLRVIDRVGNIMRLHWLPPRGRLEYVKYEVSQQLCRKEGEDKEYLDPSTHLLGTFNVVLPPIQITLALTNLVIVPIKQENSSKNDDIVSKPVMATNCLLRIRAVTIKQEIKSAWSDAIDVVVCDTENIQHNFNAYVENAQKSMDKNVDFYALQAMIDDGLNYEKTEVEAIAGSLSKEIQELEALIENTQNNLNQLQAQQKKAEMRHKALPIKQEKCNELLAKLNNIYTLSAQQLEDKVKNWSIEDCLTWFDRVGLCRFAKYHSILQSNLTEKHVEKFLDLTINDLQELGIGCNDSELNDCPRILHYINKCKKKYQQKLPQAEPLKVKTNKTQMLPKPKPPGSSKRFPKPPGINTHPTNYSSASVPNGRQIRRMNQSQAIAKHPIHKTFSQPIFRPPQPQPHKESCVSSNVSSKEPSPGPLSPPRSPREQTQHHQSAWQAYKNVNIAQQRTNYQHPLSIYHHQMQPHNFSHRSVRSYNASAAFPVAKQIPPPPKTKSNYNNIINKNKNNVNNNMNNNNKNKATIAHNNPPPPFPTYLQYKQRAYNINNMYINGVLVPDDFICPISGKLMVKPVMAADGGTYDRASMEMWLKTNDTSPVFIGQRLRNKFLMPYNELAARINAFKMQHSIQ